MAKYKVGDVVRITKIRTSSGYLLISDIPSQSLAIIKNHGTEHNPRFEYNSELICCEDPDGEFVAGNGTGKHIWWLSDEDIEPVTQDEVDAAVAYCVLMGGFVSKDYKVDA